jgi:8-oxo-dGTP pyrophosphatase MutT (NUDIX family)
MTTEAASTIVVAAVALLDASGRMLTVRKSGTTRFMNPGGKLEPGETAAQAAVREIAEELDVRLPLDAVEPLGTWSAAAANEPGATVMAHAFRAALPPDARPVARAEIAELRWVAPADVRDLSGTPAAEEYAPLLLEHFVPALLHR